MVGAKWAVSGKWRKINIVIEMLIGKCESHVEDYFFRPLTIGGLLQKAVLAIYYKLPKEKV